MSYLGLCFIIGSMLITPVIKILMEATNGLGIILENRYYGHSYPYGHSNTDNLRFNAFEQCRSLQVTKSVSLNLES